jgi:erythromycin esterase
MPACRSTHTPLAVTALMLVLFVSSGADQGHRPTKPPDTCTSEVELTPSGRWGGDLGSGDRICLRLDLQRGQFVRVAVAKAPGDGDYLEAAVLAPGDTAPFLHVNLGDIANRALSWEARHSGLHSIVLTAPMRFRARGVSVALSQVEEAHAVSARRSALARDPRVASLGKRTISLRTLDPRDSDFADLQALKAVFSNVRVVLLGEADHGDGSDFLVKSRLIRFLHAEMGFSVLAFEASVYEMWRAWRQIAAGQDPMASFAQGAYPIWAESQQLEPLVAYVADVAQSAQPLVLAGIDDQGGGTVGADTLIAELRRFFDANGIAGSFGTPESRELELLRRLHDYDYRPMPDSSALATFERSIATTAQAIEQQVDSPEGRYWAQVLRNAAYRAARVWPAWPGVKRPYCATEACIASEDRDPEMAQNLSWLASHIYPGSKIIVWAHSGHVIRNPSRVQSFEGSRQYAMGDGAWSVFGPESYTIAPVSYDGEYRRARFTIVPDQHEDAEFEELMWATGHRLGLVNLREPTAEDAWLTRPFLARPIQHTVDRSQWADNFDAFLFIATQTPSVAW